MEQLATASKRPTVREIATDGMMMHYTDPQIIKEQVAALKNLGLIEGAMESIEVHNPVLAAAIRSKLEHFIDYEQMSEKPVEYGYEGSDGGRYISSTYTWVARLHYELQTVALFGLMEILETGELRSEQIADFTVALGNTSTKQDASLAFNFNSARQPEGFFDKALQRFIAEGYGISSKGYDRFYQIPGFLWNALGSEERGRLAAIIVRLEFSGPRGLDESTLNRNFSTFLSMIFAWDRALHIQGFGREGVSESFDYDHGDRFVQGRVEFTDEGFLWVEELRGLKSAR